MNNAKMNSRNNSIGEYVIPKRLIFLYSILSVVFLILSSTGTISPLFITIFLVPSLYLCRRVSPGKAFFISLVQWSIGFGIINFWYVRAGFTVFQTGYTSFLIFIIYITLFFGLYTSVVNLIFSFYIRGFYKTLLKEIKPFMGKDFFHIFMVIAGVPLSWSFIEYFRGFFFPGFNISSLTGFLYQHPFFLQLAAFTGEHVFSSFIIFINISIYLFLEFFIVLRKNRIDKSNENNGVKYLRYKRGISFFCCLSLILVGFITGTGLFYKMEKNRELSGKNNFLLIQAVISGEKKWKEEFHEEILNKYIKITNENLTSETKFVIWPETALNFYPQYRTKYSKTVVEFTRKKNFTLFAGGPETENVGGNDLFYNSVFKIEPGRISSVYRKEMLIPFAEYCPFDFYFPFFKDVIGPNQYSSYMKNKPVFVGEDKFGFAVCFESTFPDIIKKRLEGSGALIVFSDNIWLDKGSGPQQHLATMVLRAIENRKWVISCVNGGISVIISPYGEIVKKIPYGTSGAISF